MVDEFAATLTRPSARVLDAGCGMSRMGRMGRYLAERGCDVEGLDVSPGMIAIWVVVDRTRSLAEAPRALRHLTSGQALGRVVIRVDDH